MGIVSSINSTQVENYDSPTSQEDPNAVAKPLKPAYAPNPTPEGTVVRSTVVGVTPPASYPWHHPPPLFYRSPQTIGREAISSLDSSLDLAPDAFSTEVMVPSRGTAPPLGGASLPFQPGHHPLRPPEDCSEVPGNPHMGYCPLEMGSVRATGVILSRAVRMLEATPPAYLLVPEHPNMLPSTPLCPSGEPPAPPNTAHAHRLTHTAPQYPNVPKNRRTSDLGPSSDIRIDAHRLNSPRPPTVG